MTPPRPARTHPDSAPSPDPGHPGWDDVRHALIKTAEIAELALADLRAWPADPDAIRQAELASGLIADLTQVVSRIQFDQATVDLLVERQLAQRRNHLRRAV